MLEMLEMHKKGVRLKVLFFREIPLDVLTMPDSKRKSLGGEQQYDKVYNIADCDDDGDDNIANHDDDGDDNIADCDDQ